MKFKQDTSYEMLLNHGFETTTSDYLKIDEGQNEILRVIKYYQKLNKKGTMIIKVVWDEVGLEKIKGAISVFCLHFITHGLKLDSFYFKPSYTDQ